MEIHLMQHGLALSKEQDPLQPLSPEGKKQIEASAQAIRRMGLHFELIIASTKKRSRQTAEIVAGATGYAGSIVETDRIKPSAAAEESVKWLGQFADKKSVLIAGHLPSLARIASLLLTGGSELSIGFQNGGLCRIDVETVPSGGGLLRWYVTPDQLQLMRN